MYKIPGLRCRSQFGRSSCAALVGECRQPSLSWVGKGNSLSPAAAGGSVIRAEVRRVSPIGVAVAECVFRQKAITQGIRASPLSCKQTACKVVCQAN